MPNSAGSSTHLHGPLEAGRERPAGGGEAVAAPELEPEEDTPPDEDGDQPSGTFPVTPGGSRVGLPPTLGPDDDLAALVELEVEPRERPMESITSERASARPAAASCERRRSAARAAVIAPLITGVSAEIEPDMQLTARLGEEAIRIKDAA